MTNTMNMNDHVGMLVSKFKFDYLFTCKRIFLLDNLFFFGTPISSLIITINSWTFIIIFLAFFWGFIR